MNFEQTKYLSKWKFKKLVRDYTRNLCKQELLEDSRKYKKLRYETLALEDFRKKDYFNELNIGQVRDRLRLRAEMFGDFRGSFPTKYRRRGESLKCSLCMNMLNSSGSLNVTSEENIETQTHFLDLCPLVSDLKDQYYTSSDLGLIAFFLSVMQRRADIDD